MTSPDGKGTKTCTIQVNEPEFPVYDSAKACARGINGSYGWSYGTFVRGEFSQFDDSTIRYNRGETAFTNGNDNDWIISGPRYIHPGTSTDVARRFTTPKSGNVRLHFAAEKFSDGQSGSVGMQITLNGEKIWPLDDSWKSFSSGTKNVWDTSLHLEEGDQLVFAIG
ncbi:hypothetical protein [Allobaculum mucilyticum]|uniref:hypothetical protein n=1 Tax=Allobaculum mucilyticum TaxID=2834459 RepID=UPI001E2F1846|nr:hypothetical protein [Allobaculum mucilyticum]UNT97153.1 hypothetical protein KWG62_05240 [Allobaculum mucilyticum]